MEKHIFIKMSSKISLFFRLNGFGENKLDLQKETPKRQATLRRTKTTAGCVPIVETKEQEKLENMRHDRRAMSAGREINKKHKKQQNSKIPVTASSPNHKAYNVSDLSLPTSPLPNDYIYATPHSTRRPRTEKQMFAIGRPPGVNAAKQPSIQWNDRFTNSLFETYT